jgi:hypothetical protein
VIVEVIFARLGFSDGAWCIAGSGAELWVVARCYEVLLQALSESGVSAVAKKWCRVVLQGKAALRSGVGGVFVSSVEGRRLQVKSHV